MATDALTGSYALPDGQPKVSATLVAESRSGAQQVLDFAMTPIGATTPVTAFEIELSKQLHVIAVSADLRQFLHEHGEVPDNDGHFRIPVPFPRPGLWHVYADCVPKGLGQQVMRFDLVLGTEPRSGTAPAPQPTGMTGTDGQYSVRFDRFDPKAKHEAQLELHVLRNGKPAGDITPFLGVAAHAVFIAASDLTYVHVHAAPAQDPAVRSTGMQHAMTGMPAVNEGPGMTASDAHGTAATSAGNMGGTDGMSAPLPAGSMVPSDLTLHVKAPKRGIYMLWIQFTGGGEVRTVPFVVSVT